MGAQQSKFLFKRYHIFPFNSQFRQISKPQNMYFNKLQEDLLHKKIGYLKGTKIKPMQNFQKGFEKSNLNKKMNFPNKIRPCSNFSESLDVLQRNSYENKTSGSDFRAFKLVNNTPIINSFKSQSFEEKLEKLNQKQTFFEPIRLPDQNGSDYIAKPMNQYMIKNLNRQATLIQCQKEFQLEKSIPSNDCLPSYKNVLVSDNKMVEFPVLFKFIQFNKEFIKLPSLVAQQLPNQSRPFSLTFTKKASVFNRQESFRQIQSKNKHPI